MTDPLPRPEPVLDWARVVANWQQITAAVVGAVLAVGAAFVALGLARADDVNTWATIVGAILGGVGTVLAVVMPLVGAHHAQASAAILREQVTPLSSPRNEDGHALIDVEYVGRHAAKTLVGDDDHSANMAG